MSDDPTLSSADPLDGVIASYVERVEAGDVPDRSALLAAHPALADRLRAFFADLDRMDGDAAGLRLPPTGLHTLRRRPACRASPTSATSNSWR